MSAIPPDTFAPGERVLLYLYRHVTEHGFPPSARAIALTLGWTGKSAISHHLTRLAALGWVWWAPGESGTLTLTEAGARQALLLESQPQAVSHG